MFYVNKGNSYLLTKTLILIFQSKKLGREANEAEVYIDTHTKKDGSMVDDFSREVVVCNCFLYSFISSFFYEWYKFAYTMEKYRKNIIGGATVCDARLDCLTDNLRRRGTSQRGALQLQREGRLQRALLERTETMRIPAMSSTWRHGSTLLVAQRRAA